MSKIHNMSTLESEIRFLKHKTRELEKRLDHNVTDLRQNFAGMALNSVFGSVKDQSVVSVLAERVLYGSKFQDGVVGALDKLSLLLGRIFGRKGEGEVKQLEDKKK